MTLPTDSLVVVTRGSALARAQTHMAVGALREVGSPPCDVCIVTSHGDAAVDVPVENLSGDGWFTGELERELMEGRAHLAVHSAKDVPSKVGEGLVIASYLPRADVRDCLVCRPGEATSLQTIKSGARIGTSSHRRRALIHALRPDIEVVALRGNVDTRLSRVMDGALDGIVIASAGLDRLGKGDLITEWLDPEVFVPAPAQGAIAIQAVEGSDAAEWAAKTRHDGTWAAVAAERAALDALGGGCLLPFGAWAHWQRDMLRLVAVLEVDGVLHRAVSEGSDPRLLGQAVAEELAPQGVR